MWKIAKFKMLKVLRRNFCAFSNPASKAASDTKAGHSSYSLREFKFSKDIQLGISQDSTPKVIHDYLQGHVVGQEDCKKALAIAYSKFCVW